MKLHVTPAEGEPYHFEVDRGSIIIGRSSSADLALTDPFLSRHHARLTVENDVLTVEDLGSRNGTFVNELPVDEPMTVRPGDVIRLSASSIALASERTSIDTATTHDTDLGATILRPASQLLEEDISSSTDLLDSAEALRQYAERLEILRDVHEALGRSMSQEELLSLILDRTFDHLKPQQGVIYLREENGGYYQASTRALPGESREIPLSRALVHEVLDKGNAALVFNVQTDDRFAASESIMMSGIRSMVAAPLIDPEAGSLGMIALNSKVAIRQFSEEDLELLVSLAGVAAMKIRNVALAEEAAQRRQLEAELKIARDIQVSLLPDELPRFPGYEILGRNIPARGVSGDYYVVVSRNQQKECVLFMADVSGKGIPACIVTASLEALAADPIENGDPTDVMCAKLCRRLYRRTLPSKYATAFAGVLEPASGRFTYTNAGHNTALLVRPGGEVEELKACGLPIGLMPEAQYEQHETRLDPGACLVVYTDGITEAENPEDEEYGLERLAECCARSYDKTAEQIAQAIEDDVTAFVQGVPFADDRTMLLVKRES